jgi:hypothetical protein
MGSPFVATFLRAANEDYRGGSRLRDLLDAHATYSRSGLRLSGAFHYLALAGEPTLRRHVPSVGGDGDAVHAWHAASAILDRDPALVDGLFRENVQTNEPSRSMPVLGAFLHLAHEFALPFRVFEIGASAGLISRFDRYRYAGPDWEWGDAGSPLTLQNRILSGRPQHLDAEIRVAERRASDPYPIDVADSRAFLRLQSFVWPDQIDRLQRLRAAAEVASAAPLTVERENFDGWLASAVTPRGGYVTIVLQTVVEPHFTRLERDRLRSLIDAIGGAAARRAPFAYVRMEQEGTAHDTTVRTWPGEESVTICRSDGHAQDIRWF